MKARFGVCFAAAVTILAGSTYLASPAAAAPGAGVEFRGCSITEFEKAVKAAHEDCRNAGFDGGTVVNCGEWGSSAQCWYL